MRIADRSFAAWTATFYAALGLPLAGCGGTFLSHDRDGGSGNGGTPVDGGNGSGGSASGGEPATGGATSSGGRTASGGATASGGTIGSGGATASGGTIGSGGTTASGGTIGSGGATASGGTIGSGGTTAGAAGKPFVDCGGASMGRGGYDSCKGGSILHRSSKQTCANDTPRPGVIVMGTGGAPAGNCTKDSDCTAMPYGYCIASNYGVGADFGSCAYGCTKDSECPAGDICMCDEPVGQCVHASCTEDVECKGGLCASYNPTPGCPSTWFACQTPADTCLSDADCPNLQHCTLNSASVRVCVGIQCAVGRPFVVDGAALVAPLRERDDFSSGLWPDVRDLDDGNRGVIALYWAEVGLMEHASVAAFARFALELLSLGAPPSLLTATHAAMADEMVHARDAFALAGAYAARAIGPGPLDTSAALANRSPLDIVRTAIIEGCIGETVAAVAASEALLHAKDPAVRAALARVVPDETRHAELAWRFVKWVLHGGPRELRSAAARELVAMVEGELLDAEGDVASDAVASDVLHAHGVLTPAENAEIRARVLSEIVLPCARALVASIAPARSDASLPA